MAEIKLSGSQLEIIRNLQKDKWQVCYCSIATVPFYGYVKIGGTVTGMRFNLREKTVKKLLEEGFVQKQRLKPGVEEIVLTDKGKQVK